MSDIMDAVARDQSRIIRQLRADLATTQEAIRLLRTDLNNSLSPEGKAELEADLAVAQADLKTAMRLAKVFSAYGVYTSDDLRAARKEFAALEARLK